MMTRTPTECEPLTDPMIKSLDGASLSDIDHAWIRLARQRADETRAGTAKTHDTDEVVAEARRLIGR